MLQLKQHGDSIQKKDKVDEGTQKSYSQNEPPILTLQGRILRDAREKVEASKNKVPSGQVVELGSTMMQIWL